MTIDRKWVAIGTTALLLAGCTPNDITLGASVRNNNEAQIVEPEPKYEEDMVVSGDQSAGAQQRYRTDQVKKVKSIRTTLGTSGNRSGSSSGGSN
jgi:hypothetical protein